MYRRSLALIKGTNLRGIYYGRFRNLVAIMKTNLATADRMLFSDQDKVDVKGKLDELLVALDASNVALAFLITTFEKHWPGLRTGGRSDIWNVSKVLVGAAPGIDSPFFIPYMFLDPDNDSDKQAASVFLKPNHGDPDFDNDFGGDTFEHLFSTALDVVPVRKRPHLSIGKQAGVLKAGGYKPVATYDFVAMSLDKNNYVCHDNVCKTCSNKYCEEVAGGGCNSMSDRTTVYPC